ncbi:hypothetical protein H106_07282 [Trichophyton rubrum CBS 735.88]|nr:hypothetical protein H106_07282 [Trichophyton rubrum CBS 735.88]
MGREMEKTTARLSAGGFPRQPAKPVPARGGDAEAKRPAERMGLRSCPSLCVSSGVRSSDKGLSLYGPGNDGARSHQRGFPEKSGVCHSVSSARTMGTIKGPHNMIGYLQLGVLVQDSLLCVYP